MPSWVVTKPPTKSRRSQMQVESPCSAALADLSARRRSTTPVAVMSASCKPNCEVVGVAPTTLPRASCVAENGVTNSTWGGGGVKKFE